jgi:hypothetical protein
LQIEGQSGLTALRRDGVVLEFQDEYTADEFDTTTGVTRTPAAEWPFSGVSSLAIPRGLCFIGAGSEVFCTWPHNGKLTPSRIPGLKAISVVKTCALTVERTVACWQEGKVGPKGMEYAPAKVIGALTDVRELSGVDGVRVFAVRNDGAVLSYSESDGGLRVWRGPERVKSLSVGLASLSSPHCVLYESGAVACWGKEKGRQLGTGTAFPSEDGTALPAVLKIGEDVSTAVGQ